MIWAWPGVGDAGQVLGEPPLEQTDLLVSGRKQLAGHEQIPEVSGGPPRLELVERLMRQRDIPAAQTAQQSRRFSLAARTVEPAQAAQRVARRGEHRVQRDQFRANAAGAVVE